MVERRARTINRMRKAVVALAVLPVVFAVACGGGRQNTANVAGTGTGDVKAGDCSAHTSKHPLKALGASHASSGVALAEQDGKSLALVADEDDHSIHVVDIAARKELASVHVEGSPAQVLVDSEGRVLVTLRDVAQVQVLSATDKGDGALAAQCAIPTPAEPIAMAETADRIVVTSGWGHSLDVLAHRDLSRAARVDLPREPRGVLTSADGKSAIVSHLVGSKMSVVDLEKGAIRAVDTHGISEARRINVRKAANPTNVPTTVGGSRRSRSPSPFSLETGQRDATIRRHSIQGWSLTMIDKRIVNPRVLVDPGEPDEVATYYGSGDRPAEVADVLILDEALTPVQTPVDTNAARVAQRRFLSSRFGGGGEGEDGCALPRGIAENTADHTALVACLGSNTLIEYAIETAAGAPKAVVRGRWPVAKGPVGVAYEPKRKEAIVWSQYDHAVSFVAMPTGSIEDRLVAENDRVTRLNLARNATLEQKAGEIELGRALYHTSGDHRISREGLACASCHPDGRDDALTWATQDGPRQAPMLAGRLEGTAPYAWSGTSSRVSEHLEHTVQRLGGQGLSKREMEALAAYCLNMKTYQAPSADATKVARGKELFASQQTQCSTCHTADNGVFTDKKKHDVGSHALTDSEQLFDTPSLKFVGGTAPYFHDGRYKTLKEVFAGTDGKMGKTSHLAPADIDALEAYLKTL